MSANLLEANQIITALHKSIANRAAVAEQCERLENIIEYLDQGHKYHYELFLAEIYATKLGRFAAAQNLCLKVKKDNRQVVILEALLRLSFINSIQRKYNLAQDDLIQAYKMTDKKLDLAAIFVDFCRRLFELSEYKNLLHALKYHQEQRFKQAYQFYSDEFERNQDQYMSYFSAKSIRNLSKSCKNIKFEGVEPSRCSVYIDQLNDGEDNIKDFDDNYNSLRAYLGKIIEYMNECNKFLKSVSKNPKNPTRDFNEQLKIKKRLAIEKFYRILENDGLSTSLRKQFQRCVEELQSDQITNYGLLSEFIKEQWNMYEQNKARTSLSKGSSGNSNQPRFGQERRVDSLGSFGVETPRLAGNKSPAPIYNTVYTQSMKKTESQMEVEDKFEGSSMVKINESSQGYETRYFYLKRKQIEQGKIRMYFCSKESSKSSSDSYYDLRNYVRYELGKTTKALKRSQCKKFQQSKCFAIIYDTDHSRNFYVPSQQDYKKWVKALKAIDTVCNKNSQGKTPKKKQSQLDKPEKEKGSSDMKVSKMRQTQFI